MMERTLSRSLDWSLLVKAVALALLAAVAILYLLSDPIDPAGFMADGSAYWDAAARLRTGEPLYQARIEGHDVYRYAPWFAIAWIPLTFLPFGVVGAGWFALNLAAGVYLLWPLRRSLEGLGLILIIGPWIFENAWVGQVHVAMVAAVALGLRRPWIVGAAASLKLAPLTFVAWYALNREWRKVWIALAVFAVLWAPTLLFDRYPVGGSSLWTLPEWAVAVVVVMLPLSILAYRQPRYRLLAISAASMLASPLFHHVHMANLLVALRGRSQVADPPDQ